MTYQRAAQLAIVKRLLGWCIFLPALLSTVISVMKFIAARPEQKNGIEAVMSDFSQLFINMVQFNTPFLNFFWENSPQPDFIAKSNVAFWLIYAAIFVGLALQASGAKMWRQYVFLRESITNQLILEKTREDGGKNRKQLEQRIVVPHQTFLLQIFPLYLLPLCLIFVGYFLLKWGGFLAH
ncbi:MAG: hypothetical protein XXXJIFNMEKO3_01618 [Candidatus Erwinia impunctatus]|nr:hypothetical protein XXXJIFNMEKO_01618 [Culicoides impunctatus]